MPNPRLHQAMRDFSGEGVLLVPRPRLHVHHTPPPLRTRQKVVPRRYQNPPPPDKGTVEYYTELTDHDRFLRGRKLSQIDASLAFSDGNSTFRIRSLGLYLFFSLILLLTSGVKFMVALDTRSDLFWVPCDCTRCVATDSPTFASPAYDAFMFSFGGVICLD
ncbi:Aspartyl protease family protein [Vigna angularis]|uniref:Aspartyl protease family protein n=1 Tax=Phaseolus angularis TaxID=3914 RepID=A0A8T0K4Q8_PHAAN|nr:Aspartyl protease family protein [Vigna angularis]